MSNTAETSMAESKPSSIDVLRFLASDGSDSDLNYNKLLGMNYNSLRIINCWSRVRGMQEHNSQAAIDGRPQQFSGWTYYDCVTEQLIDIVFLVSLALVLFVYAAYCKRKGWTKVKMKLRDNKRICCCQKKSFKPEIGKILLIMLIYNLGKCNYDMPESYSFCEFVSIHFLYAHLTQLFLIQHSSYTIYSHSICPF